MQLNVDRNHAKECDLDLEKYLYKPHLNYQRQETRSQLLASSSSPTKEQYLFLRSIKKSLFRPILQFD